jgi:hypothetical protein
MNNPSPSIIYERSKPITIPRSNIVKENKNGIEYNLTRNFFDPNKSSPPNSWNTRLLIRLGSISREEIVQSNH